MPSTLRRFLRDRLRRLFLFGLSWTEREKSSPRVPRAQKRIFWQQEVRIPASLVAVLVWGMLFVALFLGLGLGWEKALGVFVFTGLLMTFFVIYFRFDHPEILHDEESVMLLGALAVASVWLIASWRQMAAQYDLISPFGIPLSTIPLLTTMLLQPRLAIVFTMVLSLIFGILNGFSLPGVLMTFFGGITGVVRGISIRTRGDVTRAGLWIGLVQTLVVVTLALLQEWPGKDFLFGMAWAGLGGVLSALLALGLLPYLESFFSRLTNIKLLELADVNHPLLKRMSLEAPGTYHHSLIMASLAEAAADKIGANGLLCRVGAYFHDIGKMVKPEYFVENQGALGNPHDPLPPSMSRLVIQSHVKEGVALAEQNNLDRAIVDFIVMHHGTSRIEYFYRRAIEQQSDLENVGEEDYRYEGPRPYSKETAILMMADAVEASVRTIEEPTHQRLRDQVDKIISNKMEDGQFDDVKITLADLQKVAKSFVNTLSGIYHSRIKYPEETTDKKPSVSSAS